MTDPESPDYSAWLADTAASCRNCPNCSDCPCGACLAGGVCDAFDCRCDDSTHDEEDDRDDAQSY